jgi:hypothetical protein
MVLHHGKAGFVRIKGDPQQMAEPILTQPHSVLVDFCLDSLRRPVDVPVDAGADEDHREREEQQGTDDDHAQQPGRRPDAGEGISRDCIVWVQNAAFIHNPELSRSRWGCLMRVLVEKRDEDIPCDIGLSVEFVQDPNRAVAI